MTILEALPIACTLAPAEFKDRLASIAQLNKSALRKHERRDLVLELRYGLEARERVQAMVRNEQACCAFLAFRLDEVGDEVRLTITAPERARETADALFDQFVANAPTPASCACSASASKIPSKEPPGSKAAGVTAMTLATGAVACGVCCVLPFALPAAVLASTGSLLAVFVKMHLWVTILAILSVVGAWAWIAWQTRRTDRKPAVSTLFMMTASTIFLAISVMWPLIEKPLIRALRG
jgi:hypothetical protein